MAKLEERKKSLEEKWDVMWEQKKVSKMMELGEAIGEMVQELKAETDEVEKKELKKELQGKRKELIAAGEDIKDE